MAVNIILIIFPVMMIFAALSDLLTFTIPNRVPLFLILAYLVVALYLQFSIDRIVQDLLCGVVILLLGVALFSMNLIGGGDAKLAAASAIWLGWENLFSYGLVASIVGFVLTASIVLLHFYDLPEVLRSVQFFVRLADKKNGVPYGIALAAGGLAVYPQTKIWAYVTLGA